MSDKWPSETQIRVWKMSDSMIDRVTGRLAEKIMTGEYPAGSPLPDDRSNGTGLHVADAIMIRVRERLADMGMIRLSEEGYVVCPGRM